MGGTGDDREQILKEMILEIYDNMEVDIQPNALGSVDVTIKKDVKKLKRIIRKHIKRLK